METGGKGDSSGIKKELDSGQTKIMETGVSPEEISRSKPEIFQFKPITTERLQDLFNSFKVEYPDDPRSQSFVRQIIQGAMLRKIVTAVESLSKKIVLIKNIPTKRHDMPTVEVCVFEVDVVLDEDRFCVIAKDAPSSDFFNVNEDYLTRVILINSKYCPVVNTKLIVYKTYKHAINKQKIILQHESEDFDEVAKFIAYQMISSYCTFVESVINAFTMDLPKIISDYPVKVLTPEKIKQICLQVFERIEDKAVWSMESNRDWKRWVADEIQRNINTKGELLRAEAWATIDNICQKTVQDLNSILIELEEFQAKVLPIDHYRQFEELQGKEDMFLRSMPSLTSHYASLYAHFKLPVRKGYRHAMDKGSGISGIKNELDSDQTKIMEEGVSPEEISRSTSEIFQFKPITTERLQNLFNSFKVEYPDDPRSQSFVRQIIKDGMLRKLVTAVKSLSKEIVLIKNIPTKRHGLPTVNACVFEVDVVYEKDRFRATRKDASSNEFFNVNEDYLTRVILINSKYFPVVDAKLIVYKTYKHVINKRKIILQHEYEEFDEVAKFIAYQMISSYCTFVESVINAFTMDLPKTFSDCSDAGLTPEKIKQICLQVFERIEDKAVGLMESNRDWKLLLAAAIQKNIMKKRFPKCADEWVIILHHTCQKTLEDLNCILSDLEKFQTDVYPADQTKQIEEWLKREIIRDRSVLQKYPSILKYITGYRDSVDGKQVVKVFLRGEDKETKTVFKDCCANSKDLQFEFVNVERSKDRNKEVEQLRIREREAPAVDNVDRKQLKQIIQEDGQKIHALYSNVIGIQIGKARQVGDSIREGPCLILYCLDKCLIPFGEKPLPESIAGWPCDIREDFVRFGRCPQNCTAQNQSLPDPGCSIGKKWDGSSGSAGFLYESREPTNALGDGFFTAAHVAVKDLDLGILIPDKSFTTANLCPDDNIIVHPSYPEFGERNYRVGRVVEAFYGNHEHKGLDLAVIKIAEPRNKTEKEILTFAEENDLIFGEDIVTKRGKTTGITRGYLSEETLSFPLNGSYFSCCYAIENINNDPFFLPGDSGSGVYVIKDRKPKIPLGIAFAFLDSKTAVCNIREIVDELGLQIVRYYEDND